MTNAEQQLVEFCQALIRTPSLSGQEEQVARLIQKTMLQEGFDEAVIDRYGSVLGCIRGNRPGKTVLLDGHIDTVDLSDRSLWQHRPVRRRAGGRENLRPRHFGYEGQRRSDGHGGSGVCKGPRP